MTLWTSLMLIIIYLSFRGTDEFLSAQISSNETLCQIWRLRPKYRMFYYSNLFLCCKILLYGKVLLYHWYFKVILNKYWFDTIKKNVRILKLHSLRLTVLTTLIFIFLSWNEAIFAPMSENQWYKTADKISDHSFHIYVRKLMF